MRVIGNAYELAVGLIRAMDQYRILEQTKRRTNVDDYYVHEWSVWYNWKREKDGQKDKPALV